MGDISAKFLCILFLINLSDGYWFCGGAILDDKGKCLCGNVTITRDEWYDDRIRCCGGDTCSINEDGSATCPEGEICHSEFSTWTCGDLRIPSDSKCQCGTELFTEDDNRWPDYKFCCPSSSPSQCSMTTEGVANCSGIVKSGEYTGCDTSVCYSRSNFGCKSGDLCVQKWYMCHGQPLCQDFSDVEFCNIHNKDVCTPDYNYYKCPGLIPWSPEHRECYKPTSEINNSEYNCLTRSDETGVTEERETIDYDSIKPCKEYANPGLWCGDVCKDTIEWCNSDSSLSCQSNTSSFTTDNNVLCQNKTFWTLNGLDCNDYSASEGVSFIGRRCVGRQQHCYSAPHRRYDYGPEYNLPYRCRDSSDQVHQVGSKCNIDQDVQEYCQTFCLDLIDDIEIDIPRGEMCDIICQNKEVWISQQTDADILDPRRCQSSCSDKSYNCDACTNPEYNFTCEIGGVKHCINPVLLCDGHPACDDGSDELLSECIEKLLEDKIIKPEATVICQSPMYNNTQTVAVACDQIVECADREDEPWLCTNSRYSLVGAGIALVILFLISIFMKYCRCTTNELKIELTVKFKPEKCKDAVKLQLKCESETNEAPEEDNEPLILLDVLDADVFNRDHDQRHFRDEINLFIQKCKVSDRKQDRINKNQKLYELELRRHGGKESETALCIKNTIDPVNAKIFLDDAKPGIMRRYFPKLEDFLDWLEKKKTAYWILNKAKNITSIYVDICKDTYLMVVIYILVGGPGGSLNNFPTRLSSVIVFCQFGSIVGPLIVTGILHANDEISRCKMKMSLLKKLWKYFLAVLRSPLTPLFISQEYDDNKAARRTMIYYNHLRNDVLELMEEGIRVRRSYAKFLRIDLGLELFFQLSGQLILLFLTVTETPTTGGLESLFKKSNDLYLGLSVALGLRTVYMAYLKTVAVEKPYFGLTSKFVLFTWIIVSATLRLMTLMLYFAPGFGLFSTLHHWRREQIPFAGQYRDQIQTNGTLYLYKMNITKDQWNAIDRYDYDDKKGTHYSEYTVVSLDWYFIYFWIIIMVHTSFNIVLKLAISLSFRFDKTNC